MKKLFASILLLVYFTVSTGFVVSVHYCMNKVDSVQLGDTSSDECNKCGMHIESSGGCCKDDVKMVKMQVDQSFAKTTTPNFTLLTALPVFYESYVTPYSDSHEENYPLAHGPPLSKQDTYLQNCVFRL
ncbi:MAG: hypothetical protein EOO10_14905 [Chitinophagaceae bacterium]|nr:MAG: hypothetical protein EOO10_14905 [Chitinophagaceae bacterium]